MTFSIVKGKMNARRFCEFLFKLSKDAGKKIIVVCDNARYYKAKYTKSFVALHKGIEFEYLLPYSPELNPDEQVWNHLKQRLVKIMITSKNTMKKKTQNIMQFIQKKKGMVKSFFKLKKLNILIYDNTFAKIDTKACRICSFQLFFSIPTGIFDPNVISNHLNPTVIDQIGVRQAFLF